MTSQTLSLGETIARRLRACRRERGLTQAQVTVRCVQTGSAEPTQYAIGQIERGERRDITVRELLALALALDITPADLLADGHTVQVTDTVTVTPAQMRAWLAGEALPAA
jgi:hypothetical protein